MLLNLFFFFLNFLQEAQNIKGEFSCRWTGAEFQFPTVRSTYTAAEDPKSLEHSLKTLTFHECIIPPLLAWAGIPCHICIREIIGKPILAGGGYSLIQDVPWGLHLFICAAKTSYFVFPSGVGAWDNFISSNTFYSSLV